MKVTFFLKNPRAQNESILFARITLAGRPSVSLKYYLPDRINPANWKQDKQKAYPLNSNVEFNDAIELRTDQIKDAHRNFLNLNKRPPTPQELKEGLDEVIRPDRKQKQPVEIPQDKLLPFYLQFLEQCRAGMRRSKKGRKISDSSIRSYVAAFNILQDYERTKKRPFTFNDIGADWYNDFIAYLTTNRKLSTNYIGKNIKCLKTVLFDAHERGLHNNLNFKARYFIKPTEETANIYLNDEELQALECLDLSDNPRLDRVRDLFLIGCYTGLRYSDWAKVTPDQIEDGFITITPDKTKEAVTIPVHPTVSRLIAKYDGSLPNVPTNQITNAYLKEIGQLIPELKKTEIKRITRGGMEQSIKVEKWQLISTHTARRSFATNQFKAGRPAFLIMAITGHTTEKQFLAYIKASNRDKAQIMKQYWEDAAQQKGAKIIAI